MDKNKNKKEPWRIIVFIIAVVYIVWMFIKKDIVNIYTAMPSENMIPLLITTTIVSLAKLAALTVVIFFIKWVINKFKK